MNALKKIIIKILATKKKPRAKKNNIFKIIKK